MTETKVKLAAKLYQTRDTMRRFHGADFQARAADAQAYIRGYASKYKVDEMQATTAIVKALQEDSPNSEMVQALLIAAYVEMMEPSNAV